MSEGVQIKPTDEIIKMIGLGAGGKAQKFWTQRVAAHLLPYLPFLATNSFAAAVDRGIHPDGRGITVALPQARYLYYGELMVGARTGSAYAKPDEKKVLASPTVKLNYTKTHNAKAGPLWDKRMVQQDGKKLEQEMREYLKRG